MENEISFKKRQQNGVLLYRDGPSSFEDEKALLGEKGNDDDPPLGLNALIPNLTELNKSVLSGVAGSEVLIVYMARIGSSEVENSVDLHNIDLLIKSGANVNFRDLHGQSVMHEVALRWPIKLADYFLSQGAEINIADAFGRTPLHVATSINSVEMVKWLINNGADVNARTKGEEQTAIHFASKYNAVDIIPILLKHGAKVCDRDYKERTPIQLAAETGREDAARFLLSINAPAGVYDDTGTSCLTHMVANMPDVAAAALEQFYDVDKASRMAYYYLSYLETEKWQMIRKNSPLGARELNRREPLEEIIKQKETRLIMHPVIQRLIIKKRELFGTRYFYTNLLINFIFTTIWTVLTFALPKVDISKSITHLHFYTPIDEYVWRIVLEFIGLMMALYFVIKVRLESGEAIRLFELDKFYRTQETSRDYQYCHPRWPQEESYVRKKLNEIEKEAAASLYDAWYYMDILSFVGLAFVTMTRCAIVLYSGPVYDRLIDMHYYSYPVVLIVIWLRFMQSFRPFITFGPFIAMMSYVLADTVKFAFLFFEFYIPYCCAIWIIFGGPNNGGPDFKDFNNLMFEVFRMTIVDSFKYSQLTDKNKTVAQIISGTYFALCSITLLNLYIALLSETFSAIFGNATATAYMLQGEVLINAERKMNKRTREKLKSYIATRCSPEAVFEAQESEVDDMSAMREIKSQIDDLKRQCASIRKLQNEMRPQIATLKHDTSSILQVQEAVMKEFEDGLKRINKNVAMELEEEDGLQKEQQLTTPS